MTRSITDPATGNYCGFIAGSKESTWLAVLFGSKQSTPFFTCEAAEKWLLFAARLKMERHVKKEKQLSLSL